MSLKESFNKRESIFDSVSSEGILDKFLGKDKPKRDKSKFKKLKFSDSIRLMQENGHPNNDRFSNKDIDLITATAGINAAPIELGQFWRMYGDTSLKTDNGKLSFFDATFIRLAIEDNERNNTDFDESVFDKSYIPFAMLGKLVFYIDTKGLRGSKGNIFTPLLTDKLAWYGTEELYPSFALFLSEMVQMSYDDPSVSHADHSASYEGLVDESKKEEEKHASAESLVDKLKKGYSFEQAAKDYPSLEAFILDLQNCPDCLQAAQASGQPNQNKAEDANSQGFSHSGAVASAQGFTYDQGKGEKDVVQLTGPLSEVFTRALNIAFVKKPVYDKDSEGPEDITQQEAEQISDSSMIDNSRVSSESVSSRTSVASTEGFQQSEADEVQAALMILKSSEHSPVVETKYEFISDELEEKQDDISPAIVVRCMDSRTALRPAVISDIQDAAEDQDTVVMITDVTEGVGKAAGLKQVLVNLDEDDAKEFNDSVNAVYTKEGIAVVYGLESLIKHLSSK